MMADKLRARKPVSMFTQFASVAIICLLAFPSIAVNYEWILIISLGSSLFTCSGVLDAYCLDLLGPKYKNLYGQYRMYCAISWGLGNLAMGYFTDILGDFSYNFIMLGAFCVLSLMMTGVYIPDKTALEEATPSQDMRLSDLCRSIMTPQALFFYLYLIIMGAGVAVVEIFLFVYMQASVADGGLAASTVLCGQTVGITVVFEIPIFYYAQSLLQWPGRDWLFILAMFAYAVRVYGYTLLTHETRDYILALESLHGFTFAALWIAAVDFSKQLTPPEWMTTSQSLLSAVFYCVGTGVGASLGGYFMDDFGYRAVYFWCAVGVTGLMAVYVVLLCVLKVCFNRQAGLFNDKNINI
jgi:PPP family 3-phenylpropionic acid transporter